MEPPTTSPRRERLTHLDALRGLVMVLMVLDHARDFFGDLRLVPEDVATTTPALFATRWVTHLCAPVFVFLAGVSVALASRGRSRGQVLRDQLARGAWLIALELSVVSLAWTLQPSLRFVFVQVIAAIGIGLIAVAFLQHLGRPAVAVLALIAIAGHDALAGWDAGDFGARGWLWMLLFERGVWPIQGVALVQFIYPLVPWVAILLAGWCAGPALAAPREVRRRRAWRGGLALLVVFVLLRAPNLYGDPEPWQRQDELWRSVVSFLNVSKYPPSLAYTTLMLGLAALLLAALDRERTGAVARQFAVYGRAPLFFYVAHLYLLHGASALVYWLEIGIPLRMVETYIRSFPQGYGHGLGVVYAAWIAAVALLWWPTRRWGELKRSGRSPLWRYL